MNRAKWLAVGLAVVVVLGVIPLTVLWVAPTYGTNVSAVVLIADLLVWFAVYAWVEWENVKSVSTPRAHPAIASAAEEPEDDLEFNIVDSIFRLNASARGVETAIARLRIDGELEQERNPRRRAELIDQAEFLAATAAIDDGVARSQTPWQNMDPIFAAAAHAAATTRARYTEPTRRESP
ncbi:hypothetical protein AXK56_16670 [Tsukamurella pulmonis]|uniref:Uncharacterized protein n=1 Tax=Tsukamurella pulmonis TaxID=47312 RepID=A0A1H1AB52_9ACTN|nr:hypothetical protein [Tsukamurella pulmonis]KXO95843.1 hypothetical protein AXK56_16670 [Tsukamurella pulmonis]SDQ36968.1 hypothetical protein SAMN04489765_0143 [Tsukamurella pulmonis]SUQ39394.1 Uncharacterised protein [Tsukamurella pulmonis]